MPINNYTGLLRDFPTEPIRKWVEDAEPESVPFAYEVVTDSDLGGGPWRSSTSCSRYIQKSIHSGYQKLLEVDPNLNYGELRLGVSRQAGNRMAESAEIADYITQLPTSAVYRQPTPEEREHQARLNTLGLPYLLYGVPVDLDPLLPPNQAELRTDDGRVGLVIEVN